LCILEAKININPQKPSSLSIVLNQRITFKINIRMLRACEEVVQVYCNSQYCTIKMYSVQSF
jgi:hypothetical protein